MGVDALQVLVEHRVMHLQQLRQVAELGHHGRAVGGEVAAQAVHQATEADVGLGLVLLNHQQWGGQVTHALHNVKDNVNWTLTWHASKCKAHKRYQRYILHTTFGLSPKRSGLRLQDANFSSF